MGVETSSHLDGLNHPNGKTDKAYFCLALILHSVKCMVHNLSKYMLIQYTVALLYDSKK